MTPLTFNILAVEKFEAHSKIVCFGLMALGSFHFGHAFAYLTFRSMMDLRFGDRQIILIGCFATTLSLLVPIFFEEVWAVILIRFVLGTYTMLCFFVYIWLF